MDDDFDNDIDLADGDGNLDESLTDLGDLGDAGDVDAESFDDASELGGTRSSGGARALSSMSEPEPVRAAKKAAAPKPAAKKAAPSRAAKKKAAKKKAAPKKKAKSAKKKKPARKAGSKK